MTQTIQFETPETGSTPPPQDQQAPSIDPKFQSPEAQAQAYREAQAELTRTKQELARLRGQAPQTEEKPAAAEPPKVEKPSDLKIEDEKKPDSQEDAAKKVADAAGVDVAPYQEEYNTTGDVSPENRAKLAEGLKSVLGEQARQIVDEFIEARKVVHHNDTQVFLNEVGGAESLDAMKTWARQSWTQDQLVAFNAQVASGDRHATLFALRALKADYAAANGSVPNRITGTGISGATQAFRSAAEMRTAMADPRYKTDEAYREDVKRRLAASQF